VAVTVQRQAPFVTLDDGDRIVEVGPHAESQFGPLIGARMWDCFPGSEPLFKPQYDAARRSGEPVEFVQFYDGNVARVRAVPLPDGHLELEWAQLARVDTLTLGTLAETLDQALELLGVERADTQRAVVRRALSVIEGGA
jgi:hypothetical protein